MTSKQRIGQILLIPLYLFILFFGALIVVGLSVDLYHVIAPIWKEVLFFTIFCTMSVVGAILTM